MLASCVHIHLLVHDLKARWRAFLLQAVLPALPGLIVTAALAWWLLRLVAPDGFISLILTLLPALLGGSAVAFFCCLRHEERVLVMGVVRSMMRRT